MITKCACEHCGGHIEFEAENAGTALPCPHCGKQTLLDVNRKFKPVPSTTELGAKAMPAKPRKVSLLVLGLIAVIFALLASNLILLNKLYMRPLPPQKGIESVDISKQKTAPDVQPISAPQGMEFSAALMKNFPERVQETAGGLKGKVGWMDAEFVQIYNEAFDHFNQIDSSTSVGMMITDKNGNMFSCCYADKAKWGDFLLGLKYGDKIRLIGQAMMFLRNGTDADFEPWLRVDSIQVLN